MKASLFAMSPMEAEREAASNYFLLWRKKLHRGVTAVFWHGANVIW